MGAMITLFIASCQPSIKDFEKAERDSQLKTWSNILVFPLQILSWDVYHCLMENTYDCLSGKSLS